MSGGEVTPTVRPVIGVQRRARSTLLMLECGHDRSIGGNVILSDGLHDASGAAHLLPFYLCHEGHCGKSAA